MRGHIKAPFIESAFFIKNLVIVGILISFFLMHAEAQTIEFESSKSKGRENKTTVTMELKRSTPHGGQSSVDYTVTGTATGAGVDYVLTSGTATFKPGDKSNKDIVAIIVDDLLDEPDEVIIVTLSNPVDATLGDKSTHTYTIEDDDKPGDAKGIISLSCQPEEETYGENFELCVEIADNPLPMSAIALDFVYDQTEHTFHGVFAGSLSSDWSIIEGNQESPGKIKIEVQAGSGSIIPEFSSGSLITISLQTKCLNFPEDKVSTFLIENYEYDLKDNFIPESIEASMIIKSCPNLGDVNGDGQVTPGDAQIAFAIFLGQVMPDFCQLSTTDTNCNENISPGDAQFIFNHYLGRISLPECCEESETSSSWMTQSRFREALESHEKCTLFPLSTMARPKEIMAVPLIITRPKGIRSFSFDLSYPGEALTYLGLRKSPMTGFFKHITGIPMGEGFLRIEGEAAIPIEENRIGSLAVVLFKVSEMSPMRLALEVLNPEGDIADAEMCEGVFTRQDDFGKDPNYISFGETILLADNTLKIPVLINYVSAIKAFGIEYGYSHDKLEFLGIEPVGLAEDFLVVESNLIDEGRLRVGGFNISPIQARSAGIFFEMVFHMKEKGGFVRIIDLVDDLQNYFIMTPRLFIE